MALHESIFKGLKILPKLRRSQDRLSRERGTYVFDVQTYREKSTEKTPQVQIKTIIIKIAKLLIPIMLYYKSQSLWNWALTVQSKLMQTHLLNINFHIQCFYDTCSHH